MTDDFDRLGLAVARVLRDAFHTAEDVRREGAADAGALAIRVGTEVERSLHEALLVQSYVRQEADGIVESVRSTVEAARGAVEEILAAARREADQLRRDAAAEAEALVAGAQHALDRANALVEAERVSFEHDLTKVVAELQQAIDSIRSDSATRRRASLDRANAQAASILRQAQRHHHAVAAEVDRMIEAAAAEAAALRKAARADALRLAEQAGTAAAGSKQARPRPTARTAG